MEYLFIVGERFIASRLGIGNDGLEEGKTYIVTKLRSKYDNEQHIYSYKEVDKKGDTFNMTRTEYMQLHNQYNCKHNCRECKAKCAYWESM